MSYDHSDELGSVDSEPSIENESGQPRPSTNSKPAIFKCAYCRQPFDRETTPCMPFCSSRCQQIDLGNWLNEAYSFPADGEEERELDQDSGE